jgi:hypothetical protein
MKVLASANEDVGGWSNSGWMVMHPPKHRVFRTAEELGQFRNAFRNPGEVSAELAEQLKVERIDWTKQMVLYVPAPAQHCWNNLPKPRVEVKKLTRTKDGLLVQWAVVNSKPFWPGGFHATPWYPVGLFLVPQFQGKVLFQEQHDPIPESPMKDS